jgi:high-affinity iron transporter
MFATGLIVFRETLEAALFIGIVAAATLGLPRRGLWLAAGVLSGLMGSLALAAFLDTISNMADGLGQEVLNITILAVALLMLTWHSVWMSTQGQEMARQARQLGQSAALGTRSMWALAVAVGLCVLREGAETVLFVAGLMSGTQGQTSFMLTGAGLGLLTGALVGMLTYAGLSRIPVRHLFSVTHALILLLAGSLASQLAKALTQAGWIEVLTDPVWDLSALLSNSSALGMLLHALIGYDAKPSGLQVVFYLGAIALIVLGTRPMSLPKTPPAAPAAA